MTRRPYFYTLIALSCCALLKAQTAIPAGPPTSAKLVVNRVSRLTTLLSLTSAQQASATTLFSQEENALQASRTNMMKARQALQTAIDANDTAGIVTAAQQIGQLTTQDIETRAEADAAFQALLTDEQRAKLKQMAGPGVGPAGPRRAGPPSPQPPPG